MAYSKAEQTMTEGYYRYPTIYDDTVVFVCEDDLWTVNASGGIPRRLTANLGETSRPVLSPDGEHLAFVGREEGQPEVYLMPSAGGQARRLTYLGNPMCKTVGWTNEGQIIFGHSGEQPFETMSHLYTLGIDDVQSRQLNFGPARAISFGPAGGVVIGRNAPNPAHWKRYRGGRAGQLWIDVEGDGQFVMLLAELGGNLDAPMWLRDRIYFLSDHEGVGNLYSCLPDGTALRRHSDQLDFYARNATSDDRRIVYHAGADIILYDLDSDATTTIPIAMRSTQTQLNRKFVPAAHYLDDWALHPSGKAVAITSRGKPFTFVNWEGAVLQYGQEDGARYRLLEWLNDGRRLIAVTDETGEENFALLQDPGTGVPQIELITGLDIGRPIALKINPKKDQILFSNHRYELLCLDLDSRGITLIDRGHAAGISGFDWSHDGEWAAYGVSLTVQTTALYLWKAATKETFALTQPVLHDIAPAFDPQGKYLYFLSYREFDPVYDNLQFGLNFPSGVRPFLITLQKDTPSPFAPEMEDLSEKATHKGQESADDKGGALLDESEQKPEKGKDLDPAEKVPEPLQIDIEGITQRVIAFPVDEGRYGRILGVGDNKVMYTRFPVEGALNGGSPPQTTPAKGTLYSFDLKDKEEERLVGHVSTFAASRDASTIIYRSGNRLRVIKAGEKPNSSENGSSHNSGWLDLSRVKVSVTPRAEWRQMFAEAWRLQRDQFWAPDMGQVDWMAVFERYLPLVARVASRSEFSDLMWEMQGELGTSHAYEMGGDYRPEPHYHQGHLGADLVYDADREAWRIKHIVRGDPWNREADSPLNEVGLNIEEGDFLLALNGRQLDRMYTPAMALVNQQGEQVQITLGRRSKESDEPASDFTVRTVLVTTLRTESEARYRGWVDQNRGRVHEETDGRIGYVHIPDMTARGYAEFHRGFLAEVDREGLIIDVRYNRGGHVSQLLLEKLARRRIGYDITRWGQLPFPYPSESVLGPLVALTNEHAGSDGDIFSHSFKLMGLGPLIGKRTWGGVIGISPRHALVDGTMTTQPEYSFWFKDAGWGVENYGTDPDIEVDNSPQNYAQGIDAQLDRAIAVITEMLSKNPPKVPDFGERPSRALPRLQPRDGYET